MKNTVITYVTNDPTIVINKQELKSNDTVYVNPENAVDAMLKLSPAAFLLYMCFCCADGEKSCQRSGFYYCEMTDLPYDVYVEALNELLAHQYLTFDGKSLYFYDKPIDLHGSSSTGHGVSDEWNDDEVW